MRDYSLPMAALLCAILAGCAGLHLPGHSDDRNIAAHEKIATDTVNQLAKLYPPAKTQFDVVLSEPRSFGAMLAAKLRGRGYAVSESADKTSSFSIDTLSVTFQPKSGPTEQEAAPPKTAPGTATAIELRYTVADARTDPLLRITLKVGGAYLARAYVADQGSVAAAGAWTFRGD